MPINPGEESTEVTQASFYDLIEDELATKIRGIATEIKNSNRSVTRGTLEVGARLKTVQMLIKDKLEGNVESHFLQWVSEEFPFGRSTTYAFMHVADRFATYKGLDEISLDQSALFLISRPSCPEGAVKAILADAKKGIHITHQKAQQVIASHKPDKGQPELSPLPVGQFNVFWATPWAEGLKPADRKNAESLVLPAGKHSTLYLWVTPDRVTDGLRLMSEWAFVYKTSLVSPFAQSEGDPPTHHHITDQHTLCLVGTKGRGAPVVTDEEMATNLDDGILYSCMEATQDEWAQVIDLMHPKAKTLQLYSLVPAPVVEDWALWNHKNQQVESVSDDVDEDGETGAEPAQNVTEAEPEEEESTAEPEDAGDDSPLDDSDDAEDDVESEEEEDGDIEEESTSEAEEADIPF